MLPKLLLKMGIWVTVGIVTMRVAVQMLTNLLSDWRGIMLMLLVSAACHALTSRGRAGTSRLAGPRIVERTPHDPTSPLRATANR